MSERFVPALFEEAKAFRKESGHKEKMERGRVYVCSRGGPLVYLALLVAVTGAVRS